MSIAAERSSVRYGPTTLAYVVQRGRRVKTVAIAVDREGVLVRAPAETPLDRLDEIVRGKARWIADRLRRFRELPPPLPPESSSAARPSSTSADRRGS